MTQPANGPFTPLQWVRPAHQARSRQTLDRMLDAAEALLSRQDWAETTVAQIAETAGSSVGSFYSRFEDKTALLNALHERFIREAWATAEYVLDPKRWEDASVSQIVEALIDLQVQIYTERAGLFRTFVVAGGRSTSFVERAAGLQKHIYDRYLALLLLHRDQLLHPSLALAADFSTRIVQSMLLARVLYPEASSPTGMTDPDVASELSYTCLSYLGVFPDHALDA